MNIIKRITVASVILASAGTTIALSACGGSSGPPSAASVVAADGYTTSVSGANTSALLGSGNASFGPQDISSGAAGLNNSGNEEVVVVLNAAGTAMLGAVSSQLQSAMPAGVTANLNGDILRVSGSQSAMGSLSS